MANADQSESWAWPKLIESLHRDIDLLRQSVADSRKESQALAEMHRRQVEELIAQLREVQSEIRPVVDREKKSAESRQKLRDAWVERAVWACLALVAVAVWEYIKRSLK